MRVSKAMLLKVVVFTIVCLLLTVALGLKLANSRLFADTYDMKAEFEDATGVLKGDAVKIAGVDVGRVTGTEIEDGKAVLSFNVDEEIHLPTDSQVAIRWRNVLGQRFVYIYPGDDEARWDEGDTIPVSQTNDVADIGEFLNRVGPILKAIDPEQANAFLDAVNTALASNEENIRTLLDAGASLASDLSERDGHIARTITNADTIMEAFASQDDQIASIIDAMNALVITQLQLEPAGGVFTLHTVVSADSIVSSNSQSASFGGGRPRAISARATASSVAVSVTSAALPVMLNSNSS